MPNINIFVACHHPIFVPNHPLLIPIQVGAALTSERFPGFLYDDTGDNISSKNRSYCELTAQYWAWKNINVDYYGFFHYRRYLFPAINAKKPTSAITSIHVTLFLFFTEAYAKDLSLLKKQS